MHPGELWGLRETTRVRRLVRRLAPREHATNLSSLLLLPLSVFSQLLTVTMVINNFAELWPWQYSGSWSSFTAMFLFIWSSREHFPFLGHKTNFNSRPRRTSPQDLQPGCRTAPPSQPPPDHTGTPAQCHSLLPTKLKNHSNEPGTFRPFFLPNYFFFLHYHKVSAFQHYGTFTTFQLLM